MQIDVTASPSAADHEVVLGGIKAFIVERTGLIGQPLAVLVRDPQGVTLGGLLGRTTARWLYIDLFWLPDSLRGNGLGTRIMQAAEAEAMQRECLGAHLNTYDFQAPGFYTKLGYTVFGSIDDHPPGHTRYWMKKRFQA